MCNSSNFKILNDLNNGVELHKFDEKAMSFRRFFCKLNILSNLVRDTNFQTWDAYVSLNWKSA